jgi:hypothetical protein
LDGVIDVVRVGGRADPHQLQSYRTESLPHQFLRIADDPHAGAARNMRPFETGERAGNISVG